MHALVTGAAGFVGSHLTKRLCDEGYDVIGVDSFTDYYDIGLKRANAEAASHAGVKFIEGDLNVIDLASLLDGIDVVFHLAGQPGVRASWGSDFSTYTYCNIEATQRLLEACRGNRRLLRLVFASSSSVYGDAERYPTSETDRPQPISPYGVTKLAAEHLCSLYATAFDVPTVSLRYFTVYGPRQRPDMAFTRFAMAAARGNEITVYGSGAQTRDFTYVDDVVEANLLAATREVPPGTVLNVAGGSHTSVNETLQIFEELVGSPLSVTHVEAVAGDVGRTGGDTTAIRSLLGWRPTVSLREGITQQFGWAAALVRQ
ncbi:NAD-dependent epimerase/dehydratase family protein [Mycobacterium sp. URHB0044]|uniref:NAD-dependent epimerase/dehydratase family protein n=1 Tax=Mycobacterium sp. URHB0044 TaxID=1380386 RepID=UPI00048C56DE|nr:NAD-dependent epimerase/dehydratase family protein [Mycobacterium sp. URHB0044]